MVAQEIQYYNDETKLIYLTQLDEFMKKHKIKIGIDKLRLCYNVINDAIISELEAERPMIYELFDFTLHRIEGKHYNDIYAIVYDDVNENGEMQSTKFGELRFNLKSQEDDEEITDLKKVWVYVENQILYDETKAYYLSYITDHLGLELNNLTACEINVDTTRRNMAYTMKKHIRDKKLTTILNGKKIVDRKENRPELRFMHIGNMDRYKDMTLYIMPKKAIKNRADAPSLCFYNKLDEINNSSGKKYISHIYDNPTKLYRSEIRFTNEKFREFLDKYNLPLGEVMLFNKGFQWCVFEHFFNSIIRFKKGDENIPLDLLVV